MDFSSQFSSQLSSESIGDAVQMEMQLLQEIYYNELEMDMDDSGTVSCIRLSLEPGVGESGEECFVRLTLVITLPSDYPFSSPTVCVRAPRGLSEAHVDSILDQMRQYANKHLGSPCLYSLIDLAKDSLSDNNRPSGECAVCLAEFEDSDNFHKTPCYHYFHVHCLLAYAAHWVAVVKEASHDGQVAGAAQSSDESDGKIPCPICRHGMHVTLSELEKQVASAAGHEDGGSEQITPFQPSRELRQQQKRMRELKERQQERGGLIDKTVNNTVQTFSLAAVNNLSLVDTNMEAETQCPSESPAQSSSDVVSLGGNVSMPLPSSTACAEALPSADLSSTASFEGPRQQATEGEISSCHKDRVPSSKQGAAQHNGSHGRYSRGPFGARGKSHTERHDAGGSRVPSSAQRNAPGRSSDQAPVDKSDEHHDKLPRRPPRGARGRRGEHAGANKLPSHDLHGQRPSGDRKQGTRGGQRANHPGGRTSASGKQATSVQELPSSDNPASKPPRTRQGRPRPSGKSEQHGSANATGGHDTSKQVAAKNEIASSSQPQLNESHAKSRHHAEGQPKAQAEAGSVRPVKRGPPPGFSSRPLSMVGSSAPAKTGPPGFS